jgi:hypothetical protein
MRPLFVCLTLALGLVGCDAPKPGVALDKASSPAAEASLPAAAATPAAVQPATAPATDKWLGKWTGPEGTFLQVTGGGGTYEVTIQNLDGPRKFQGRVEGGQIAFERDGKKEILRATNGADTGMKWLSEKSDCLTVRTGEGYCRD